MQSSRSAKGCSVVCICPTSACVKSDSGLLLTGWDCALLDSSGSGMLLSLLQLNCCSMMLGALMSALTAAMTSLPQLHALLVICQKRTMLS